MLNHKTFSEEELYQNKFIQWYIYFYKAEKKNSEQKALVEFDYFNGSRTFLEDPQLFSK